MCLAGSDFQIQFKKVKTSFRSYFSHKISKTTPIYIHDQIQLQFQLLLQTLTPTSISENYDFHSQRGY